MREMTFKLTEQEYDILKDALDYYAAKGVLESMMESITVGVMEPDKKKRGEIMEEISNDGRKKHKEVIEMLKAKIIVQSVK